MKKLLIAVGAVVAVLILAVAAAPFVLSAAAFKGQILARVQEATGRAVRIGGPLSFGFFPNVKVEATGVTLANAPGTQAAMAQVKQLDIVVKLIPLLSGRVVVERLVLIDPAIDLEIDAQGRPSWSVAASGAPLPAPAPGVAPPKDPSTAGLAALSRLRVKDVTIENGDIVFADRRTNQHYELRQVAMTVSAPRLDAPFTIDGTAMWRGRKVALSAKLDRAGAVLRPGGKTGITVAVTAAPVTLKFTGGIAAGAEGDAGGLAFDGKADLAVPSVRDLVAWSGQAIALPQHGFGALAVSGTVHAERDTAKFTDATFALDAIKASGALALSDSGARPSLTGTLQAGVLDFNPYLGPPAAQGWSDAAFDTALLRQVDADLTVAAQGVRYRKLQIGASAAVLHLKDGKLALGVRDVSLYRGDAKGTVAVDAAARPAVVTVAATVTGVDLGALLRDAGGGGAVQGGGGFTLAATARGDSERALIATLTGTASFRVADGALGGVDLGGMLQNSAASFKGGGATTIERASGSFTIRDGIMANHDLAVSTRSVDATGAGSVNLPARTLNYRIAPKLIAGIVTVPVIVSGPWDHLGYEPDVAGIAKGIVTAPITVVGGAAGTVDRVGHGVGQGVGGALKSLFGN